MANYEHDTPKSHWEHMRASQFQDCSEFRFVYEIAPEKVAKYKLYLEYFNFIIYYITSGTTFQS